MKDQAIAIAIYAALLIIGGLVGFLKAGSVMSVVMGGIAGVALLACAHYVYQNNPMAFKAALGLICALLAFFGFRFLSSFHFMPSGLMFLLSVLALIYLTRK